MVLHLSRGAYDPKEHRFLRNLVESYPEFRVAYTCLVVICTDNPLNLNEFRDSGALRGPFWEILKERCNKTSASKSSRIHTIR